MINKVDGTLVTRFHQKIVTVMILGFVCIVLISMRNDTISFKIDVVAECFRVFDRMSCVQRKNGSFYVSIFSNGILSVVV